MDEVEVFVELNEKYYADIGFPDIKPEKQEVNDKLQTLQDHFTNKIKGKIGLSMKVTLSAPGNIPRSEGGKLSRIKDMRK